jgi:hypothetical protein
MSAAHVVPKNEQPSITPFPARQGLFGNHLFFRALAFIAAQKRIVAGRWRSRPPIVDGTEQNLSPAIQKYILKNTAMGPLRLVLFRASM